MASSTLLYIAWPLTLGLSYMAGSMIISNKSTTENSKDGNQSPKVSRKNSLSNGSTNETSAATIGRSSIRRSPASKDTSAGSYDIKEITDSRDPQIRLTKLVSMIDQLSPADLELLLANFRERELESADNILDTFLIPTEELILITAWAKTNPEKALAYAKENRSSVASKTALRTWAGYAPDAAIKWVELNYKDGYIVSKYLVGIIEGISSSDPERATSFLPELMSSDYHDALNAIIPHVSNLGTEKATAWLANIKGEELRATATNKVVCTFATKDPQATADWLLTLPAKNLHVNAESLAAIWAEKDSYKAAEWTSSLEGKTRIRAASRVLPHFVRSDPNKAATWMKTMSKEPTYRKLVKNFMHQTVNEHPEIALANMDQFNDESYRNQMRRDLLSAWARRDKGAATQWMQSNNIGTRDQEKILSKAARVDHIRRW